jgi:hypothetical protein
LPACASRSAYKAVSNPARLQVVDRQGFDAILLGDPSQCAPAPVARRLADKERQHLRELSADAYASRATTPMLPDKICAKSITKGFKKGRSRGGPFFLASIHLPPQSIAMLNIEQLRVLEHLEQFLRLSYVLSPSDSINEERSQLNKISDAFVDLGLSAVELSVQLSQVLHLAHLDRVLV